MLSEEEKKLLKIFKAQVAKEETEYFSVNAYTQLLYDSHKTVLNLITRLEKENENSISKDIVKKYLEEEQERYNVYKREVEQNNNLKSGLWRHLGAKNMCEKILGIERLVTLD